jgi:uncharacterized short protein YbdD (DUF466 family)
MADSQEIALLLYQFIQAAEKEASGVQREYDRYVSHAAQKEPILKTYEECVGKLSDKDCAELRRIVREMLATPLSPRLARGSPISLKVGPSPLPKSLNGRARLKGISGFWRRLLLFHRNLFPESSTVMYRQLR